ncbi:tail fiber domain-containing protein, partial [archaeon]|nr:tail fiber domain-containing protein [archaeon]
TFYNYFTITEEGNVGINNGTPKHLLDVNGNTNINGKIQTSNILGNTHGFKNVLNINFEENEDNSNLLYVYGDSIFNGNVGIGVTQPENSLDVIGKITCHEIECIGSNVTLLNTDNISDGILPIARGGTSIDNIKYSQLLFGGADKIEQNSSLSWDNSQNILSATKFRGDGSEINRLNAGNFGSGTLPISRGGTGNNRYSIVGGLLVGNLFGDNAYSISQTELLNWNNNIKSFNVSGDLRLPDGSNIYIGDSPLKLDDFDSFPDASSNIKGMVKISFDDFKFNDDNQLVLATQGSSKWGKLEDKIFYPIGVPLPTQCVGIGAIPDDAYRLDVNGDINTSNGVFRINGIDVISENSNIISNRINTFTLDNIAQPEPDEDGGQALNGGNNNKFFSIRDGELEKEFFISSLPNSYDFVFDDNVVMKGGLTIKGEFALDNPDGYTNFSSMKLQRSHTESILIVNQTYNVDEDDTIDGSIVNFQKGTNTQFRLNKDGNVGIGRNISMDFDEKITGNSIEPAEKLHVIGNIISTGFITAYYSDERLKTFTSKVESPLEIIDNLNGYYYEPNKLAIDKGFSHEKNIGLSAQEVQKVIPEIVKLAPFDTIKDKNGVNVSKSGEDYLTICYEKMAPVFVEAIKELKKENQELKNEIIKIKQQLNMS